MSILLLLILIIVVIIIFCLLAKLEVEIKIILKNGVNYSFLIIRLLRGILRLRINLSFKGLNQNFFSIILRKTDSSLDKETSLEEVFKFFQKNHKRLLSNAGISKYLFSKTEIRSLSLNLEIGTGDAAQTAIISGAIIFIFSTIQFYIRNRYSLGSQILQVIPYFQRQVFNMDLDCIIHLRIGHIIIAGIRIIGGKLKGGERSGRTSY